MLAEGPINPATPVSDTQFQATDWSDPITILKVIIFGFLTGGTILQNTVLLIAVTFDKRVRRSLPNFVIINLAVADLLVGLLVLPFSAWNTLTGDWPFGQIICFIWSTSDVWCCSASIYSLCVITVDRYIGVTRPLTYPQIMTRRRHLYLIFGVWVWTGIITFIPVFIWPAAQLSQRTCYANSELAHVLSSCSGVFFIPFILILVLYWRIYKEASRVGNSLRVQHETGRTDSEKAGDTLLRIHVGGKHLTLGQEGTCRTQTIKFLREKKAAITVGIVVGAFIFCWFPFFTILIFYGLDINFKYRETIFSVCIWLGYSNSFLSPIIYLATNRRFKDAFLNCVRHCCTSSKL